MDISDIKRSSSHKLALGNELDGEEKEETSNDNRTTVRNRTSTQRVGPNQRRIKAFKASSPPLYAASKASDIRADYTHQKKAYVLRVCRALMEYGAPTHRIECYMRNTAAVLDLPIQIFYMPGCAIISFSTSQWSTADSHIVRCTQALDLAKLYKVHQVYKGVIHGEVEIDEALQRLERIAEAEARFSLPLRVFFYGVAAMSIGPVTYSARPIDLGPIFLLGCLLGSFDLVLAPRSELFSHVHEIIATVLIAFLARALGSINLPHNQMFCFSALCQASIVMILPGFTITNSALELQCKHIVAGSVRLVYGLVITLFLAFSITLGTTIFGAMDSSATSLTECASPWPVWWQLIFVPLFTIAWVIVKQAPIRKMPAMVVISSAGWAVNHFSGQYFTATTTIAQTLGALTIGVLANLYSRLGHEMAAALLHPAIFIQVPGSLAASGGLISGIRTADALTHRDASPPNSQSRAFDASHTELLNAAFSMIQIAIGITVGLSVSALLVYPIRKKTGRSGIFSF